MVNMPNLWWTFPIYGEHAQFMMNMLNLWWTYSIYGEHAQFKVNILNLGWPCLIWYHDWIGLEKLPQKDSLNVQIHPQDQKIQWYLYWSQLICTVTADLIKLLDWPWKTTPKMTLWMSYSVHWIKKYSHIYIEVSYWIGLEKLPQNDPLDVQIRPLVQKIQWSLYWSQLICTVTADLI